MISGASGCCARRLPADDERSGKRRAWLLFSVVAAVASTCSHDRLAAAAWQPADEALIRAARAQSNEAIARHDLDGIARAWMEDIHVVASTSTQTGGRDANRQRMAGQFARRPDTVYVRRPTSVEVYAPWDVASERGEWTGRWTEPDGPLEISGTYQAQWRRVNGRWLLQAELFVPTRCAGAAYCRQRP